MKGIEKEWLEREGVKLVKCIVLEVTEEYVFRGRV